jgi:hypothetical protein
MLPCHCQSFFEIFCISLYLVHGYQNWPVHHVRYIFQDLRIVCMDDSAWEWYKLNGVITLQFTGTWLNFEFQLVNSWCRPSTRIEMIVFSCHISFKIQEAWSAFVWVLSFNSGELPLLTFQSDFCGLELLYAFNGMISCLRFREDRQCKNMRLIQVCIDWIICHLWSWKLFLRDRSAIFRVLISKLFQLVATIILDSLWAWCLREWYVRAICKARNLQSGYFV